MTCTEFQSALEQAADERAAVPAAAREHARRCPHSCGELLADHELLLAAVAQWKQQRPVAPVGRRVVDELLAGRLPTPVPRARRGRDFARLVSLRNGSVLALLIVGLFAAGRSWERDRDRGENIVVQPPQPEIRTLAPQDSSPHLAANVVSRKPADDEELAAMYSQWIGTASEGITSSVAFWLPDAEAEPDSAPAAAEWEAGLKERLKPLEKSFRQLLEVPSEDQSQTPLGSPASTA